MKKSNQKASRTLGPTKALRETTKSSKPAAGASATRQVKTKPSGRHDKTRKIPKKARTYTDKELGLPALNMVTPAGVQKPRGKKKGKVFVDDQVPFLPAMVRCLQVDSLFRKA